MKRLLSIVFLFAIFASTLFAQARKIDDVGNDNEEGWTLRSGHLLIELKNHFINYLQLLSERLEILIGDQKTKHRNMDSSGRGLS